MRFIKSLSLLGLFLFSVSSFAFLENEKTPLCMDGSREKKVDNAEVLYWKFNTKNQFKARGYVSGTVQGSPFMKNDHLHFSITLGAGPKDTLEVIYNKEFGNWPALRDGDRVDVCGDYITSYAKAGSYEASPAGAIIHWVHYNPANRPGSMDHEHGFIMVSSDKLVGFDDAPRAAWDGVIKGGTAPGSDRGGDEPRSNPRPQQPKPQPQRQPQPQERQRRGGGKPDVSNLPEICRSVAGRCQ